MSRDITAIVDKWFADNTDGEFIQHSRAMPYSMIGSPHRECFIVFTTKPEIIAGNDVVIPEDFGMIGRYGLPHEVDLQWLREFISGRRAFFVGDVDPVDLMVFVWLRQHLGVGKLAYLGISDRLLASAKTPLDNAVCQRLTPAEVECTEVLATVFPDMGEVVGHECLNVLNGSYKLELEGMSQMLAHKGESFPHVLTRMILGGV